MPSTPALYLIHYLLEINSINKSVRASVSIIRYEYETRHADDIIWIPGRVNPTDPGTNTDSPLTQEMLQTMASGEFSIDLSEAKSRFLNRFFV